MTTKTEQEHSNGWCCVDCLMLLANGDTPPEWDEAKTAEWLADIERQTEGCDVTLGRMFGEDGCEHTSEEWHSGGPAQEEHAENCERQDFSWRRCDVCGSNLGGAREAVTFWFDRKD